MLISSPGPCQPLLILLAMIKWTFFSGSLPCPRRPSRTLHSQCLHKSMFTQCDDYLYHTVAKSSLYYYFRLLLETMSIFHVSRLYTKVLYSQEYSALSINIPFTGKKKKNWRDTSGNEMYPDGKWLPRGNHLVEIKGWREDRNMSPTLPDTKHSFRGRFYRMTFLWVEWLYYCYMTWNEGIGQTKS